MTPFASGEDAGRQDEGIVARLTSWVANEMPYLNEQIDDGRLGVGALAVSARPLVQELAEHVRHNGPFTRSQAREMLRLAGFITGSLERQVQQLLGGEPGHGLAMIEPLEPVLLELAVTAEQPPYLTHQGYWLENRGPTPLTFTGNPEELFFHARVIATHELESAAAAGLRPICTGEIVIASIEAITAMRIATDNILKLREQYVSFYRPSFENGPANMTPIFFMTKMRTYLSATRIGGRLVGGPNAANVPIQSQLDFLLGAIKPFYVQIIQERMEFMGNEERAAVQADMALPSLLSLLLGELALDLETVMETTVESLALRLALRPGLLPTARALDELLIANGALSGSHFQLISRYLIKAQKTLPKEVLEKLAVKPDAGTGGRDHNTTMEIMRMRHNHPVVERLHAALKLIDEAAPGAKCPKAPEAEAA